MAVAAKSLEACLIEQGAVSEAIIEKARERQRDGKRLGDVLQEMGAIDGKAWAQALASHYGLPYLEQLPDDLAAEYTNVLPINFAKRYQLLPVRRAPPSSSPRPIRCSGSDRRRAGPAAQADQSRRRFGAADRRCDQPHLRHGSQRCVGPHGRSRRGTTRADGHRLRGDAGLSMPTKKRRSSS